MKLRSLALIPVVLVLMAACAGAASPSASPSAVPSGSAPDPSPAVPSGAPSNVPGASASPTPTTGPVASPNPSPRPSDKPVPALSAAEETLSEALRVDARIDCAPRRADLPSGAVAGIECRIGSALVDRVGVYGFDGSTEASGSSRTDLTTYIDRLASAGIAPGIGNCAAGTPGDASWPAYLPDEGEDGGPRAERAGCYLDSSGTANVRVTCYGEIYIGVLGASGDLAALNAWTWKVAKGEGVDRDPPGICAARD